MIISKSFAVSFAAALIFVATASADTVQGNIVSADSRVVHLAVYDAQGRLYPNTIRMNVDRGTRLDGVRSAAELRPNEPVRVDASQERDGEWHADSIAVLPPAPVSFQQPAPQSNALMTALSSPKAKEVMKQGLSGAVVGGVASAASGGKAGKGALIGAGTGVAAGFIADYLNKPSQPVPTANYAPANAPSDGTKVVRQYDADGNIVSEEFTR